MVLRSIHAELLANALSAIAHPARLELLGVLWQPRTIGEIEIRARRGPMSGSRAARQTVQGHVDRLVAAGLVVVETARRGGRLVPLYRADPAKLQEIARALEALGASRPPEVDAAA